MLGGIAAGTLTAGDQLPTVRQVAVDLSINPNTVVRAYRELEIRGVLETQQGTGTFISHQKVKHDEVERQRQLNQLVGEFVSRAGAAGFTIQELQEQLHDRSTMVEKKEMNYESGSSGIESQLGGVALLVVLLAAGAGLTALLNNPAPLVALALAGLYLLFAIRKADQWEKVAVLRFGRYIGLRGPGLFHMIPVVDTLSRYVDQRVRVANVSAESTLTRDTVPVNVDAIVFWMVWNAEKSILEVQDFTQAIDAQRADGAARIDRPPRAAPDGRRARNAGQGTAAHPGREDHPGASPCNRWRFATCRFRRPWRTPCRGRRRRSANGGRASFWARRRRRSRRSSGRPR